MKFNINGFVKITLTKSGAKHYRDHWRKYHIIRSANEGDVLKMQMHEMIKTFGDDIYLGCNVPFETTIEILED